MLDEFPALGRLVFFESALAFMAGYGLKAFLIAQSLNQIEKAYGQNNAILDNCHVRVSFATNDERTARRVSDALGTATELRAMKNYAGHRLSPWLGHLMVSRQETARPLLTPGEVMQLPPADELVMVSGCHPIRARKARYFEDRQLAARILSPPSRVSLNDAATQQTLGGRTGADNWAGFISGPVDGAGDADPDNGGIRREPELPVHEDIAPEAAPPSREFAVLDQESDDETVGDAVQRRFRRVARQAALDPDDGMEL
jgi:type IV secretion system protein VirD4